MGGEHLALSNYDELSASEITAKLDLLTEGGTPFSTEAIREYEKSTANRKEVLKKLDQLDGVGAGAGRTEPQAETLQSESKA